MNNRKYWSLLLLCIVCFQILTAQKLPSTLLWRISGNGLQKPSYLYGTMHLTDERIFNIGDSLYNAIEKSDGFAMEIDPGQFTPFVIDAAKRSAMETLRIKDMLQKEEFKKYGKALAKKLGKNENEITTADILHAKNKWIQESYSTGKMQTFLDVYLFDIARRQGKWTGGVEDLEDQENLVNLVDESDIQDLAMSDDSKAALEKDKLTEIMIRSYISNNLNAIDSISHNGDSLYTDALLYKRNKKMAMRMDSLGKERSMVFAVGAAHLPGNKGLITLLREKGFTVEPVFSSKKIKPADYKVAEVELPWYDVNDESGYYSAQMPGKAGNLTLYAVMNMKMYFDVFKSTLYMATALQTPYTQKMADSVFSNLTSYYFGTKDYSSGKLITINGVNGREFLSTKNNYSHGYLLFKEGIMYITIAVSMKNDTANAASINRFLHSFAIHPVGENKQVYSYLNEAKAYKINIPAQPRSANDVLNKKEDTTIMRDLNMAIDPATGAYYFFGTNEAAKGFSISNDSTMLANIKASQKNRFNSFSTDTTYFKNGHRVLHISGMMKDAPLMLNAVYEFRGNRWYALVAMYDTAKGKNQAEAFLNSFQTLDYANAGWKTNTSDDGLFTTWLPEAFNFIVNPNDGDTTFTYECFDTSRADNYDIYVQKFDDYYWQENDTAFWKTTLDNYKKARFRDSILYVLPVVNGEVNGYEIALKEHGSHNIKRVRKLLYGKKLYSLIAIQDSAEINNGNTNKFFETFRFNKSASNNDLFVSKASVLLNDLSSTDSAMSAAAKNFLNDAPFTASDLPLLHQAVLKNYMDDDENNSDVAKQDLKRAIINLEDTSSYTFAKEHYNDADDITRLALLDIMASFKTQQNFEEIKTLLLNKPPGITPSYSFVNTLFDSLKLTATVFPQLFSLVKDSVMAPVIIRIADKLIDSNLIDKALMQNYQQDIIKVAKRNYITAREDEESYDAANTAVIDMLGRINSKESNTLLQQWSLLNDSYLQMCAVIKLLENKQVVNPAAIKALAADKYKRVDLYDTLKSFKQEALFPSRYLSQKSFAESLVYIMASDDEYPDTMIFLSQKVLNFKGKQSRFYFYKVGFGEEEDATNYIACAGPFNINTADATVKNANADVYYDEEYDAGKKEEQAEALIQQMESWYKTGEQ